MSQKLFSNKNYNNNKIQIKQNQITPNHLMITSFKYFFKSNTNNNQNKTTNNNLNDNNIFKYNPLSHQPHTMQFLNNTLPPSNLIFLE